MASIDDQIADAVRSALADVIDPIAQRLTDPAPLTYSVHDAAIAIGCSEATVYSLVDAGRLPTVPHLGRRIVIPRTAVEQLVHANDPSHLSVAS